jgi:hypothetical protein
VGSAIVSGMSPTRSGSSSAGTPMANQCSRQVACPSGAGSERYPSASDQKITILCASAKSIVSCSSNSGCNHFLRR